MFAGLTGFETGEEDTETGADAEQLSNERKLFSDAWQFLKTFYGPQTDQEWADMIARAEEITGPTRGTELEGLTVGIMRAIVDYIGQQANKSRAPGK